MHYINNEQGAANMTRKDFSELIDTTVFVAKIFAAATVVVVLTLLLG